jgi:hypothetical protein
VGIVMIPDAYSAANPYNDVEISLVSFYIEELERVNAIVITALVTNNGNSDFQQYHHQVYLVDHLDRKFSPNEESRSFFSSNCLSFGFFDAGPSIPEQLTLCYEVPKDSENLYLLFQDWEINLTEQMGGCKQTGGFVNCNNHPPIYLVPEKQIGNILTQQASGQQASGGCGAGTVLVDGVCQLADNIAPDERAADIDSWAAFFAGIIVLFVLVGIAIIIIIIIIVVILIKRRKKTTQPAKQDLEEYEKKYLANQKPAKQKPAEKKETSAFCENCGKSLKPTAKFCGGCGTPRS